MKGMPINDGRIKDRQQGRTYVPAVGSTGRLAESSSCGQSANMMLSPLCGISCQRASVKKGMKGCSKRRHVSHTYTSTRLEAFALETSPPSYKIVHVKKTICK